MLDTSARLLKLLSLLQTPRDWAGSELAERLGVSARTVRRDIERLRELGYPVRATQGTAGYRLGAGAAVPPLLLDDDEAVAVAVGLRTAAGVAGVEETSVRALAKLEQVLPSRLRHRVQTLQSAMIAMPGDGPTVDASVLTAVAAACRGRERLRFDYSAHDGTTSRRITEPHRLVGWGRRWYLVAWDVERDDWRTFRADRIEPRTPTGPRFAPRELPGGDVVAYLGERLNVALWHFQATLRFRLPAARVAELITPTGALIEPVDENTCTVTMGADSMHFLAVFAGLIEADFEVVDPPELRDRLASLGARYLRAAGP
ncbi:helix-turn-helix transcriptional regulator [Saccharopolyspora shandongensis]|uniref:helix-turn-helix transcriptional regulator n=1 Tax=Saccharopolyspora shandongensis TaxID=418495 RepID=UPI0033FF5D80